MWEEVFEPACSVFGLSPVRADRISEPGDITDQVFEYLRDADIVIADLSYANPNVMYELGLRHSRDAITVQLGEHGRLPFDISTIRTIQFIRSAGGRIAARDELIAALRAALTGRASPVRATSIFSSDSSPAAPTLSEDVARSIASPDDEEGPGEPGFLEVLAEGEEAITHVTPVLRDLLSVIQEMGAIAQDAQVGMPTTFAGRLQVARRIAAEFAPLSSRFETGANEFYDDVSRMDLMVEYIFGRLRDGEEDPDEAAPFVSMIESLVQSSDEAAVGIAQFRTGTDSLRRMSRDLEPISRTLAAASSRVLEGMGKISGWRELIDQLRPPADGDDVD